MQGLAAFRDLVRRELPDVRDDIPEFQFHGDACGARLFRKARGIVTQSLICAHMDEQWRKTCEIGVERRRERIARIRVADIQTSGWRDSRAVKHGAAACVCADGFARGGKIGPRREKSGRSGKRRAGGPQHKHEGEREPSACRIPGHNEASRGSPFVKKTAIRSNGVIHRSRKTVFGSQAIIRSEDAEAVHREKRGDRTMGLRGTGKIAAAMQIKQHVLRGTWRLDPFSRDAI